MPLPKVIPALADLTQDIAGPLPVELLHDWAAGTQDLARAGQLLDGFRIEGTVVSSDTSGLSRLTEEMELLDVIALISAPKEIVHAVGVAIGGKPIGTWVADNTEMYYPALVAPDLVLAGMSETQHRISTSLTVGIGMCVHSGIFYELGGGLYGRDADVVEQLAEDYARGGEVLVTHEVASRFAGTRAFAFEPRPALADVHEPGVFALATAERLPHLEPADTRYPHPFPAEFFDRLRALKQADNHARAKQDIYASYLDERVVVFVARAREGFETGDLTGLLDGLVTNALMDTVVRGTTGAEAHLAGLGGGLAILTFLKARDALDFALALRTRFADNGLAVKIGIDRGPVLVFPGSHGPTGITGDAVNVASKISEDAGTPGKINLTARVVETIPGMPPAEPFQITISNVVISGVTV
jgi:class 3 adenylate cyclase